MDSAKVIDNTGDGQGDVVTPRYTTYQVRASYHIEDRMIGDFTADVNSIAATNTATSTATLSKKDPQVSSASAPASQPLFLNPPASIDITKKLITIVDGRESEITYAGDYEKYGPLTYSLTDENGAAVDIYMMDDDGYHKVDLSETPLKTGKLYYVAPGVKYQVKETIPSDHVNDMKPSTAGGDKVTSPTALEAGKTWHAVLTNKETRGTIVVTKTDEDGAGLEGAEFKLVNKNDSTKTWTRITGRSGIIRFEDLPYGTYILTEEKAPAGYTWKGDEQPSEEIIDLDVPLAAPSPSASVKPATTPTPNARRVALPAWGIMLILVGLAGLITIPIVYLLFLRKGKDEDDGNDSNSGES